MPVFKRPDSPYWWIVIKDLPSLDKAIRLSTKFPKLDRFKKDAENFEHTLRADHLRGKYFDKPATIAVRELFDAYLPYCKEQSSFPTKRSSAKKICEFMGDDKAANITLKKILDFRLWRRENQIHELTINRDLDTLSAMYEWAIAAKTYNFKTNPVSDIKHYSEKKYARDRIMEPQEAKKLLPLCSPLLRLIIVFEVSTGLRKGELIGLRWSENIDFTRKKIKLYRTKEGKPKILPMHPDAFEILKHVYSSRKGDWVFSNSDGSQLKSGGFIRTEFDRLKKKLEIKNLRWHDLRHTFASELTEDAQDIKATSMLMGHANTKMTDRYAHLADQYLSKQITKKRSYLGHVLVTLEKRNQPFSLN